IYGEAGFNVVWNNCFETEGTGCVERTEDNHLVLHVLGSKPIDTKSAEVYGMAFLGEDGDGSYCDVFYAPISELYTQGRAPLAKILGVVIAHELGHLLLGAGGHSSAGLMRPQLPATSFSFLEPGAFAFDRTQAHKISARLRAGSSLIAQQRD